MASELKGPDISEFNGKIDFSKMKDACDFAILRCGYGSDYDYQDDSEFVRNAEQCEKYGIPYGVYLYSYASDSGAALSEAEHVLRLIKGRKIDFGVWYDLEDETLPKDRDSLTDICLTFIRKIEKAGYTAGFYTSLYWIENRFADKKLKDIRKWIAQWNSVLEYGGKCSIWQHTDSGSLPGIQGPVDMNRAFENLIPEKNDTDRDTPESSSKPRAKTVRVTADIGLNVRSKPGTDSDVLRAVPCGEVLEITKEKDGWGKTDEGGWVCMEYTKSVSPKKYRVNADIGLNIRSGPGTGYDVVDALSDGEKIKISRRESNWGKILGRKDSWVCMDYLERA